MNMRKNCAFLLLSFAFTFTLLAERKFDELPIKTTGTHIPNILDDASNWESISGKWNFEKGEVIQTAGQEEKPFLLRWKGELPAEPFKIEFEMNTYESKSDTFIPEAYLVVRSDSSALTGYGFGLSRSDRKQLCWKEFPSDSKIDYARDKSGINWKKTWQKFTLMVDGPCYELYYPALVIRGYIWGHINQKGLTLRTNGAKAAFRNIQIIPLSKTSPIKQFEIVAPEINANVKSTRPVLEWLPLAENIRDDFDYHITIADEKSGKLVASDITQENNYRPAKSLEPGTYRWMVEAKTFYGAVWGGKFSGTFIIPANAKTDFDALNVSGPTPSHFTQARPELVWEWLPDNIIDRVEIYQDKALQVNEKISNQHKFIWEPRNDLVNGLNRFTVKLFHGNQLVESVETFAIRTRTPEMHAIRQDGVLLCNGKVFVPIVAYRDPSDSLTETDGLEEAGFSVTHSYHFDGGHYYSIKKDELAGEFSREKVDQLINDAKKYLRICNERGVKVALSIRRSWVYYHKHELIREYVAALMGEPGLLTWYLYDEPDHVGISAVTIRNAYRIIKNTDPYHPVSLIYANADLIPRLNRSCDILWSQAYHEKPVDVLEHIATQFQAKEKSAEFGKGVNNPNLLASWAIIGAFDNEVRDKKRLPSEHRPTPPQIIAQTYAAMIGGARGVAFYWFPHSCYDIRRDTPHIWKAIVDSGHQLNAIMPYLLEEGEEFAVPSDKDGVVVRAKKLKSGKIIVVLLNTQDKKPGDVLTWQWNFSAFQDGKKIAGNGNFEFSKGELIVKLESLKGIAILLSK